MRVKKLKCKCVVDQRLLLMAGGLFLLLFVYCSSVWSQKPAFYFQQINVNNGLSNNKINCLLKDKRGFMWIGTDDGLNRYDGQHFTIFRNKPGDTSSLSGNIITDIKEDPNGILWIATADGGLTRYNYNLSVTKQFKQYKHSPGDPRSIPVNMINCLLVGPNDQIWLGTSGAGVLQFNTKTEAFTLPLVSAQSTCTDLCFDRDGTIWAGRQGGGYCKINPATGKYQINPQYLNLYAKLPYMAVNCLLPDSEGVWIGSWDKALYQIMYDGTEKKVTPDKKSGSFLEDEVSCLAKDKNGNLYIGGKNNGLQFFNKSQNKFHHFGYDPILMGGVASNSITCLLVDDAGILWVGSDKGISKSSPFESQFVQIFLPFKEVPGAIKVYDFLRSAKEELWVGTNKGIFIQKKSAPFQLKKLIYKGEPLEVTAFYKDESTNILYVGTNYSLFQLNTATWQPTMLPNTDKDIVMGKLIQSRIVSIQKDTVDGRPLLVVLPYGHFLAIYDLKAKKWISRADTTSQLIKRYNLKDNLIRKMAKCPNGSWLFATYKEGLGIWRKPLASKVVYYKNNPADIYSLSSNQVYDFLPDKKGNYWLSTFGGGLNYFDKSRDKIFHIPTSANLSEGIALDKNDNVWGISNGNLFKYTSKKRTTCLFTLPDIYKTGGVSGKIFKDENGELLVAGKGYFIRVNPEKVRPINEEDTLFFTDFKIFNTSYNNLLTEKTIVLNHKQSYFSFEFSAPSYRSSQPVDYYCKMEGEDADWVSLGKMNTRGYSNLRGGHYTFMVQAVLPGSKKSQILSIKVTIIPPVWRRWWFFVLIASVSTVLIYLAYRYRIVELLKRQAIRNKIAQDLHDSMGSTLSSISVYSQVAKIYQEQKRNDELASVLNKIGEASTEMISDMNDIVWSIQPANDDMTKVIDRMESFAKPLCVARGISFEMKSGNDIRRANLPMAIRKNVYLIFKEAINNAIKYSQAERISVTLVLSNGLLQMTILDNGTGFNLKEDELAGNGIRNIKMRTEEMKGKVILSSSTSGTTIVLRIPISIN